MKRILFHCFIRGIIDDGQVETEETENWNGKLKRKTGTEKLKSGNGRQHSNMRMRDH